MLTHQSIRRLSISARAVGAVALLIAVTSLAAFANAPSASAHHTSCYWDSRTPNPYGSYDKYAYSGAKNFWFYITAENSGARHSRVYFAPEVHGHGHSCLRGPGAASISVANIRGDYVTGRVQYRKSGGAWVTASTFTKRYGTLFSNTWRLDYASPTVFTHGRVVFSYGTANGISFPRHVTCALGRHGQYSYSCSSGNHYG